MRTAIAAAFVCLLSHLTPAVAEGRGFWVYIPETTHQLHFIAPSYQRIHPDKVGFLPIVGSVEQSLLSEGVFCETFRQIISLDARRREGFNLDGALGYMAGTWKRPVCRQETVTARPIGYAHRGLDVQGKFLIVRWQTETGRIIYSGQHGY